MGNAVEWGHADHEMWFRAALEKTHGYTGEGEIDREFGSALFILTGMASVWPRLEGFLGEREIDFERMMGAGLSGGESLVVAYAWNLFNGHAHPVLTPVDLITEVDDDMLDLVISSIYFRKYGFPKD